jgi:hypothetical protein
MGGGVGKALSGLAVYDKQHEHAVLCLEKTQTADYVDACVQAGVKVWDIRETEAGGINVRRLTDAYDIVQLEWWHHPLMAEFMAAELAGVPCRLVVWSHISGCGYPRLPFRFVEAADAFVFASPYSMENPSWTEKERQWAEQNARVVVSSGNDYRGIPTEKKTHEGFQIGYIGFLGYEKLHPDFTRFCEAAAKADGARFILCGDMGYAERLRADMSRSAVYERTEFRGYVKDVENVLSQLDVFLYPLHPQHTGTAENALLEAMAAGVPPVALNQCTEKYLIQHMETGVLVENPEQCGEAAQWLREHPEERKRLGRNASEHVRAHYTLRHTISGLEEVYRSVARKPRRVHDLGAVFGRTPAQWFRSCYAGDIGRITGVAAGMTKGSVRQYHKYFPGDALLREWGGGVPGGLGE